ncbi:MAG: hypothetical protein L5655_07300 [Thermosediminibacteraceae bacterium]|nr:hypothetical protein [Thermosediminibacteraceae bacterium]
MFRRNRLIIISLLILFLFSFYLINNLPERVVRNALEQISTGNIKNLKLDKREIEKIEYFVKFATFHKHLNPPFITIRKVAKIENKVEVIASFIWVEYGQNGQVIDTYTGTLLFSLIKISPLKWEIQQVCGLEDCHREEKNDYCIYAVYDFNSR